MAENEERLREILSKILLIDEGEIDDELSRDGLADWDSMTHLMLISEVESVFGITFTDEEMMAINTIGDLRSVLRKGGVKV